MELPEYLLAYKNNNEAYDKNGDDTAMKNSAQSRGQIRKQSFNSKNENS